jgi:hypothetical protein
MNKIARTITLRCSFVPDSARTTVLGRLRPLAKRITQSANDGQSVFMPDQTRELAWSQAPQGVNR